MTCIIVNLVCAVLEDPEGEAILSALLGWGDVGGVNVKTVSAGAFAGAGA